MKALRAIILIASILSAFSFVVYGVVHSIFGGMWAQAHGGGGKLLVPISSGLLLVTFGIATALMLKQNWERTSLFIYAATQALLSLFISTEIVKETNFSSHDITGPYILYSALFMVNSGWILAIWKALEKRKLEPDGTGQPM